MTDCCNGQYSTIEHSDLYHLISFFVVFIDLFFSFSLYLITILSCIIFTNSASDKVLSSSIHILLYMHFIHYSGQISSTILIPIIVIAALFCTLVSYCFCTIQAFLQLFSNDFIFCTYRCILRNWVVGMKATYTLYSM